MSEVKGCLLGGKEIKDNGSETSARDVNPLC
jgi:hypothetical protein